MKTEFHRVSQRSIDWYALRLGRLTGSRAADMLALKKNGEPTKAYSDLVDTLICERITGTSGEFGGFVSKEMAHGIETESAAIAAYEAASGNVVNECGFLSARDLMVGASLDGYIDEFEGILEVKCPSSRVHLGYLRSGMIPPEYLPQLRHNIWVSGAKWCEFVSFDNRFPVDMQLLVIRLNAADADIPGYEKLAVDFLARVKFAHDDFLKEAA